MKKILIITTTFVLSFLYSCYEPIPGSGVVIEDKRNLQQIISVKNNGIAKVFIEQGAVQSVIVKTDDNFVDEIKTEVNNTTLEISNADRISPSRVEVYIVMADITSLELNSSGSISVTKNFNQGYSLMLWNSGSGNINIESCNAKSLEIFHSGSGISIINNITVETGTSLENTGSGLVEIKQGTSVDSDFKLSSSGSIKTSGFISKKCLVENTGSGNIFVNVSDDLDASISGSGNIYYWGNPVVKENLSGSGRLIKKN